MKVVTELALDAKKELSIMSYMRSSMRNAGRSDYESTSRDG